MVENILVVRAGVPVVGVKQQADVFAAVLREAEHLLRRIDEYVLFVLAPGVRADELEAEPHAVLREHRGRAGEARLVQRVVFLLRQRVAGREDPDDAARAAHGAERGGLRRQGLHRGLKARVVDLRRVERQVRAGDLHPVLFEQRLHVFDAVFHDLLRARLDRRKAVALREQQLLFKIRFGHVGQAETDRLEHKRSFLSSVSELTLQTLTRAAAGVSPKLTPSIAQRAGQHKPLNFKFPRKVFYVNFHK